MIAAAPDGGIYNGDYSRLHYIWDALSEGHPAVEAIISSVITAIYKGGWRCFVAGQIGRIVFRQLARVMSMQACSQSGVLRRTHARDLVDELALRKRA